MNARWRPWILAAVVAAATAPGCSGSSGTDTTPDIPADTATPDPGPDGTDDPGPSDPGTPDTPDVLNDAAPDAASDAGPDTGPGDTGPDQPIEGLEFDRKGAWFQPPVTALTRIGRDLWIGGGYYNDLQDGRYRSALARMDLDSGRVKVFEAELPTMPFVVDGEGNPVESGPVPTARVVPAGPGRYLVDSLAGVLELKDGAFTLHPIEILPDKPQVEPLEIALDAERGRLWAATNVGLVRMDPVTFAVQARYGLPELGWERAHTLALDPATGAVYVSVFSTEAPEGKVARVLDDQVSFLVPGQDGVPKGLPGDLLFHEGKVYVALGAWDPAEGGVVSWDGTTPAVLARESQLTEAAFGKPGAFGAQKLALAAEDGILVVGGMVGAFNFILKGGGLAWIRLSDNHLAGVSWARDRVPGDHWSALAWDPDTRRVYGTARQPCSDVALGNVGMVAISFRPDGSARVERPMLSGLRTLAVNDDGIFAGLRSDNPAIACNGVTYLGGLVRVKGRGVADMVRLDARNQDIYGQAAPVRLAERDGMFAMATRKDGFFVGAPDSLWFVNTAIDWGVSLYQTDVDWTAADTIWLAGPSTHHPADPPHLKDAGPKGAVRITLDAKGLPAGIQRFVSVKEKDADIPGLPTSEVQAIVPAANGTYLVCGPERITEPGDRDLGLVFYDEDKPRLGGVALVKPDDTVEIVADSEDTPDPRAAAVDDQGRLLVADAEVGLRRIGPSGIEAINPPAQQPPGSRPLWIWTGAGDDLAIGYSTGASVRLGGVSGFVGGVGWVWQVEAYNEGVLLLATDEGLGILSVPGADVPGDPRPEIGDLPPFRKIDLPVR